MERAVSLSPDWVSATFPVEQLDKLLKFFGQYDMTQKPPRFGYTQCVGVEGCGISIMWAGATDSMGVHLQLSGSGLKFLKDRGQDILEFFRTIKQMGAKLRRFDLAWDCVGYGRNAAYYRDKHTSGELVTRLRKATWTESRLGDGPSAGTFYLGSRQSNIFVRCYDKGVLAGEEDLTRIEMELKNERAEFAFELYLKEKVEKLGGLLRSVIDLRVDNGTTNVTYWKVEEIWVQMLGRARIAFPIIDIMTKIDSTNHFSPENKKAPCRR